MGLAVWPIGETVAQGAATGVRGYVTLATGYWDRGVSHNDGGLVAQAGADYQHVSGFFAGAAVADVDYAEYGSRGDARELELDAYLGYHRRNTAWSWTLTLGRYLYPGVDSRYEYGEVAASVGFRDRLFFSTSYADDYYSLGRSAWNSEVALSFPLPGSFEVSAALGRFDLDLVSGTRFTHWNAGISKVLGPVALDLRYYQTRYEFATVIGDPDADQYVLSMSYGFRGAPWRN